MLTTNGSNGSKNINSSPMRMVPNSSETGESGDSGYGQLLGVLWRRRLWFLVVFFSVLSVTTPLALRKETIYQSSFRLLVEPNYKNEEQGKIPFTDSTVELDYTTQLQLMKSSELIQRAVDKLQGEYPTINVHEIKQTLSLVQVQESDVATKIFEAVYTSNNALKTQKVLEAIKTVYQQYNLEQQTKRLNEGLSFINQQLPVMRSSLLAAEETLKQFRIKYQLVNPESEADAAASSLRSIEQERDSLKAQHQETQARHNSLQQKLGRSSKQAFVSTRLSQSSRYQRLLDQIQQIDINLSEQRTKFTDNYPTIQSLIEQRQKLQGLLREEAGRVLETVPSQLASDKELLKTGQLSEFDQSLTTAFSEAQTNLLSLQARDQILAQTEQKLRNDLNRFPALIAKYNSLKQEVEVRRATLQQLLEARQDLGVELNRGGFNWQVVEPPQIGYPIGPSTKKDLMVGGVVAAFLGGLVVFVREAIDDSVRTSNQLKEQGIFPLLGIMPKWQPPSPNRWLGKFPTWQLAKATEPLSLHVFQWQPFRESLDLIYQNLQLLNTSSTLSSLVVTSALEAEGKSTLTLGLAFSASRLHQRVLVIDTNLRNPSLHDRLGLPNEQGLSTLLTNETEIPIVHTFSLLGVSIDLMTAGPIAQDPVRLLGSQRMRELIKSFEQTYDLVLLDTPAILGVVDAMQVASYARGVIMVGRLEQVTQAELSQAIELISQLNIVGMVANGAKEPKRFKPLALSLKSGLLSSPRVA